MGFVKIVKGFSRSVFSQNAHLKCLTGWGLGSVRLEYKKMLQNRERWLNSSSNNKSVVFSHATTIDTTKRERRNITAIEKGNF